MVYRYHTRSNMPRPESFTVDIKKAQSIPDKAQFWQVNGIDACSFLLEKWRDLNLLHLLFKMYLGEITSHVHFKRIQPLGHGS